MTTATENIYAKIERLHDDIESLKHGGADPSAIERAEQLAAEAHIERDRLDPLEREKMRLAFQAEQGQQKTEAEAVDFHGEVQRQLRSALREAGAVDDAHEYFSRDSFFADPSGRPVAKLRDGTPCSIKQLVQKELPASLRSRRASESLEDRIDDLTEQFREADDARRQAQQLVVDSGGSSSLVTHARDARKKAEAIKEQLDAIKAEKRDRLRGPEPPKKADPVALRNLADAKERLRQAEQQAVAARGDSRLVEEARRLRRKVEQLEQAAGV